MRSALRASLAALAIAMVLAPAASASKLTDKALADPTRSKADHDADAYRKPAETLDFSGVKPGMKVGELFPGGGYFTRPLSDIVGPTGKVYMLETTRWKGGVEADQKVVADPGRKNVVLDATPFGEFKLPEKVDLFWITQNYHDLHIAEYGKVDLAVFNKRVFDSLKPGGTYFILDQAGNPGIGEAEIANLHRIDKAQIIKEVQAAGFKLAGEGDFLHRTSDDHTKPIFELKGMTDQYALKFVKPK
jgi:predicted methyltransferase